jgi:hypothetical protein
MPQSSGSFPSPIWRRSAMTFSTRGCSLNSAGSVVSFSASIFSSGSETDVSTFWVHLASLNLSQFTA